mgnify:CR=1 FL=1
MPDTEVFLEALHDLLARRPEARRRLRVAGSWPVRYRLRGSRAGARADSGIVEFTGPRAHRRRARAQRRADVLMLWQPRNFPTMVPGKLYEYFGCRAADRWPCVDPAIEIGRDGAARRRDGRCAPGDRDALTAALDRHYAAWTRGRAITAERPAWLDEHTRDATVGAARAPARRTRRSGLVIVAFGGPFSAHRADRARHRIGALRAR